MSRRPPTEPPEEFDADATYWGRYKGRWRQCFLLMFVIGFIVITIERAGEVHTARTPRGWRWTPSSVGSATACSSARSSASWPRSRSAGAALASS